MLHTLSAARRAAIAFVAVFVVTAAACADDREPTSPSVSSTTDSRVTPPTKASAGIIAPGAKPVDQVGFTKLVMVTGSLTDIPANNYGSAYALCPAGSHAVAGGYEHALLTGTNPFVYLVYRTTFNTQTGWLVGVDNRAAGNAPFKLQVWVLCVS